MHAGPAVERNGDWFGSAVNTAARVSALASGGEVLVTEATRQLAGDAGDFSFRPHGHHRLRNLKEPVVVLAAVRHSESGDRGLPIDPVCRMAIDPERAAGVLVHGSGEYHFCSLACVEAFVKAPEDYGARDIGSQ